MAQQINSAKDLIVYRKAHHLAMETCEITKGFPPEDTVRIDGAGSKIVPLGMHESTRGVGEKALRGPLRKQIN